jgi:hypothetical protein
MEYESPVPFSKIGPQKLYVVVVVSSCEVVLNTLPGFDL